MENFLITIEPMILVGFIGKIFKGISGGLEKIGGIGKMFLDPLQTLTGLKEGGQALGLWGPGKQKSTADSYGPESGTQFRSHLDAAFPELNPWEKAGAQQGGGGIIQSALNQETQKEGFGVQKQINNAQLANQIAIANIDKEKAENVAKIQSGATIEGATIGAESAQNVANINMHSANNVARLHLKGTKYSSDQHLEAMEISSEAMKDAALSPHRSGRTPWSTLYNALKATEGKSVGEVGQWMLDNPATALFLSTLGTGTFAAGVGASAKLTRLLKLPSIKALKAQADKIHKDLQKLKGIKNSDIIMKKSTP